MILNDFLVKIANKPNGMNMSSLHHENILEDCFEVAMESFRINNKLTHEQLDELITISKGTYDAICSNAYKLFQDRCI